MQHYHPKSVLLIALICCANKQIIKMYTIKIIQLFVNSLDVDFHKQYLEESKYYKYMYITIMHNYSTKEFTNFVNKNPFTFIIWTFE